MFFQEKMAAHSPMKTMKDYQIGKLYVLYLTSPCGET